MKWNRAVCARLAALALLVALSIAGSGCRYVQNRTYDFCDMFQMGVGVASENPTTGWLPPSFGLYAQATEYVNFGAMWFSGYTAEWDGRGFFAGHEERIRLGFLPFQFLKLDQDYAEGHYNYFKMKDSLWTHRMNTRRMRWMDAPAKELEYEYWADELHLGTPIFHRGWQYWENCVIEAAFGCPFTCHLGVIVRLGFDVSEISDFIIGFTTIDFKSDDMTREEFEEKTGIASGGGVRTEPKPASDEPKEDK